MTTLRYYQREAIDATYAFWGKGGGNPLIDLATGTGKSIVIGTMVQEILSQYPVLRVICLVHTRELVEQNAQALLRAWPQAPIGINSAGLGQRNYRSQIVYASIQSVYKHAKLLGPRNLVVIDEAHMIPREGEGMYRQLFDGLREHDPDLRIAGFTATPYRLGTGRLDQGEGRIFDKTVYGYGIAQGVKDGYLTPLVAKGTSSEIDVSGVTRRGGEFVAGSLERAADNAGLIDAACSEIIERGQDRRSWLLFCAGVSHAMNVRDALRAKGIAAETVTGDTPGGERASIFKAFKAGRIRALCGMNVFTTGFDAPAVDLIAMLRPTLSTGLYVQMLGRGTRLCEGKTDCMVLDYAGNVRRHGPVDDIYVAPKNGGSGGKREAGVTPETVRARICPNCETYNSIAARFCVECDYEWPVKHDAKSDVTPVMASGGPKWVPVSSVKFYRHEKEGSAPSLRAEYHSGMNVYREWICLQHSGRALLAAQAWWRMCDGKTPAPRTIEEAQRRIKEIKVPSHIAIRREKKFWRVAGYRFTHESGALEYDEKGKVTIVEAIEEAA